MHRLVNHRFYLHDECRYQEPAPYEIACSSTTRGLCLKAATAELVRSLLQGQKEGKGKEKRNKKSCGAVAAIKASLGRLPEECSRKTALGEPGLI